MRTRLDSGTRAGAAHRATGRLRAAYLYGIVRWPAPWADSEEQVGAALETGVGDPPSAVTVLPFRHVAALLSVVSPDAIGSAQGVRGLRRDMRAHANVLNAIVALRGTVLPAAFGLVFPQGDLLGERFLHPQYRALDAHLDRLEDSIEVTLRAVYVEGQALREVVAESPQLGRAGAARSLESKIELGKRVAQALRVKRDRDARRIVDALSPAVREMKLTDPGAEMMVLNASFLVPRKSLPKFDRALEEVSRSSRGRMQFDCVGPLPPYSFVDLRL